MERNAVNLPETGVLDPNLSSFLEVVCALSTGIAQMPFAIALLRIFRLLTLFFVSVVGTHFFGRRCCASIFYGLLRSQTFVDGLLRNQAARRQRRGNKQDEH